MIIPTDKPEPTYEDFVLGYMACLGLTRAKAERRTETDIFLGLFKPSDWSEAKLERFLVEVGDRIVAEADRSEDSSGRSLAS